MILSHLSPYLGTTSIVYGRHQLHGLFFDGTDSPGADNYLGSFFILNFNFFLS